MNTFNQVIESLEFIKEDSMIIKRVKEKVDQIICLLQKEYNEANLDKSLRELEELDSSDVPAYDRTLLWDVISIIESSSVKK